MVLHDWAGMVDCVASHHSCQTCFRLFNNRWVCCSDTKQVFLSDESHLIEDVLVNLVSFLLFIGSFDKWLSSGNLFENIDGLSPVLILCLLDQNTCLIRFQLFSILHVFLLISCQRSYILAQLYLGIELLACPLICLYSSPENMANFLMMFTDFLWLQNNLLSRLCLGLVFNMGEKIEVNVQVSIVLDSITMKLFKS